MKRIYVTGASGFIGSQVMEPLRARGFEVFTDRIDLMDPVSVTALMQRLQPSHLLHLAWYAEPGKFWTAPQNLEWEQASLHLYDAFAVVGGKRFIAAGTCAEYDWNYPVLDERETPCQPHTLYGQVKHRLHLALQEKGKTSLAWGRVFFLYGPHEKRGRLVSDVIASLLNGQDVQTTAGTQIRDFMHLADVADAFAALCDSDVEGPVNIASGEPRSLRSILEMIGDLTGRGDLIQFGARPMPPQEPPQLSARVARLQNEVGFTPRYTITEGLKDTVTWWQANL